MERFVMEANVTSSSPGLRRDRSPVGRLGILAAVGPSSRDHHGRSPSTTSLQLVGRVRERAWLEDALERIEAGQPRVLIVGGNAGIGKSRLVHDVIEHRAEGWLILTGHCVEAGETGLPYAPLSGILAAIAADPRGAELLADVASTSPGLLPLVVSESGRQPVDSTSGLSQLRLLDALVRLLTELGRHRPTVTVIEDVHWADPSTRAFVSFFSRNVPPHQRLGVVLTTRTDEMHRSHPLRPLLGELTRLPVVERIDLGPLSPDELGDLITAVQGSRPPRSAVQRIADRSGGNPFFAEQLLAVGADRNEVRAPADLADLLLHRVDRLTTEARYILEVASLAGQRVEHDVLIAVADRKEGELAAALQEAADAHLFEPEAGGTAYSFRHALLSEVLAAEILPAERRRLHARFAEVLDARASPEIVARHRLGAGDLEGAFAASLDAALEAQAIAAPSDELVRWERVLHLWPHADDGDRRRAGTSSAVALAAARAAVGSGQIGRAFELARRAIDEAGSAGERARARLTLVPLLTQAQASAREDVEQATAVIEEAGSDVELVMEARYQLARAHLFGSRFADALPLAEAVVVDARRFGRDDIALGARATAYLARCDLGELDEEAEDELIVAALHASDVETGLWVLTKLADLWWPVDAAKGEQIAAQAYDYAAGHGVRAGLRGVWARETLTLCRWLNGNWDALELLAENEPLAANDATTGALALEVEVDIARGRLALARRRLELARQMSTDPLSRSFVAVTMIDLCAAEGDVAGAVAVALEALDDLPPATGFVDMEVTVVARGIAALADAHDAGVDLPDGAALLAAAERAEGRQRTAPTPRVSSRPLTYMRAQRSRLTRTDVGLWRAALAECERHRYEACERRTHLSQALLEAGDASSAATELGAAAETAGDLGAAVLMRRIASLAARARIPIGDGNPIGDVQARWGLTEREHQVLRLVAEGYTNRQIGDELFISGKTASVHVSNILNKLGAGNRSEAAAIARRNGLLGDS
jgi:DNA-binding CsgD family transcriptional regulator